MSHINSNKPLIAACISLLVFSISVSAALIPHAKMKPASVLPASRLQSHAGPVPVPSSRQELALVDTDPVTPRGERLDRRLEERGLESPGSPTLSSALKQRNALLAQELSVTFDAETPLTIRLAVRDYPTWLQYSEGFWSSGFRMNTDAIRYSLESGEIKDLPIAQSAEVVSMQEDRKKVVRATMNGKAVAGYTFDLQLAAERIASAFEKQKDTVVIPAKMEKATIIITNEQGKKQTLTLLATGITDYAGSTPGRLFNLHKAIEERINNVVVPPNGVFSYVAMLDAPVTLKKGWKKDLVLMGGGVSTAVGGGICQGATTLFRAALLAGLPIVEKRNHSLFVDHYEPNGIGLDATAWPDKIDHKGKNDTGNYIVLQGRTKGDTGYVDVFGIDDGRKTHLDGPYFIGDKDRPSTLRPLSAYQIGWERTVWNADGSIREQKPIVATYFKPLWGSLIKKYRGSDGMAMLKGLML